MNASPFRGAGGGAMHAYAAATPTHPHTGAGGSAMNVYAGELRVRAFNIGSTSPSEWSDIFVLLPDAEQLVRLSGVERNGVGLGGVERNGVRLSGVGWNGVELSGVE